MKKEYSDHWANMEDVHLLSRLRIGQMFTNFFMSHGYLRDEKYPGKDVFYMSDDEFIKRFRDSFNGIVEDYPEAVKPKRAGAKQKPAIAVRRK